MTYRADDVDERRREPGQRGARALLYRACGPPPRRRRSSARPRPIWRRSAGAARHVARRDPALAARACRAPVSIDAAAALAMPGVACVVTGEDARRWTRPFAVAVKTAMEQWCLAIDRVRYVGEPVAVVLARDRYRRGRTRADRGRIPAVAGDRRSRGGGVAGCAAAASGGRLEHRQRPLVSLRRSRGRLRRRRRTGSRSRPAIRAIPARRSRLLS